MFDNPANVVPSDTGKVDNDGQSSCGTTPADTPGVVTVGAIEHGFCDPRECLHRECG